MPDVRHNEAPLVFQQRLSSPNQEIQLAALKELKHVIIGHHEEKEVFASSGIVPTLLEIYSKGSLNCQIQAAVIMGSLAYGSEQLVTELLAYPVIDTVLIVLDTTSSQELISTSLRILVTMLEQRSLPLLLQRHPQIVGLLDRFLTLRSANYQILKQSCKLIPLLAPNKPGMTELSQLTPSLAAWISVFMRRAGHTNSPTVPIEEALNALSCVVSVSRARELLNSAPSGHQATGTLKMVSSDTFIQGLIHFTRSQDSGIRLSAVELLSRLQKFSTNPDQKEMMTRPLLPTLVPILDRLRKDPRVGLTLSYICRDDERSAAAAYEVGVIKRIFSVLKSTDVENPKDHLLIESNLLALAGIACHKEDQYRVDIVDNGGLQMVTRIMSARREDSPVHARPSFHRMKVAACHLMRALSRSVRILRTSLSSKEVMDAIMTLLYDEVPGLQQQEPDVETPSKSDRKMSEDLSEEDKFEQSENNLEVRAALMAIVCNLILEFSPHQKPFFEKGMLEIIIGETQSSYPPLRTNSVWALKHAIFDASKDTKIQVLNKLTPAHLLSLCDDPVLDVQEQALEFVRNFLCRNNEGVDHLLEALGVEVLFDLIDRKITEFRANPNILTPVIYILVHIAAGTDAHRDIISQHEDILEKIVPLIRHFSVEVRTASVWLVINMTYWAEGDQGNQRNQACKDRAAKLIRLGFKRSLQQHNDPELDVRERIKTALFQLEGLCPSNSHAAQGLVASN